MKSSRNIGRERCGLNGVKLFVFGLNEEGKKKPFIIKKSI